MDMRWQEVFDASQSCTRHFVGAADIFREGMFDEMQDEGYRNLMAFLHAMQSGHSSLEDGLLGILAIVGEEPPVGRDWHAKLITRAARATPGRPAILTPELAAAAHETGAFRHRAVHAYDTPFSAERARYAVEAAIVVAEHLESALKQFVDKVDPS
jgi:hypothetical protein